MFSDSFGLDEKYSIQAKAGAESDAVGFWIKFVNPIAVSQIVLYNADPPGNNPYIFKLYDEKPLDIDLSVGLIF